MAFVLALTAMLPVDPPAAQATGVPSAEFDAPISDTETLFASDFTTAVVDWPGSHLQDAGGNWYMRTSANRTNGTVYGPPIVATADEVYRATGRFTGSGAGANAAVRLCFFNAAGALISCPASVNVKNLDFNVFRSISATAPAGTASLKFQNYNYYTGISYDDLHVQRVFTTEAAVQAADSVAVEWTETVPQGAPSITSRSLQRQAATADGYGDCLDAAFADDGTPDTGTSPVVQAGLESFTCYRWILTLTDSNGGTHKFDSGLVYIVDHQIELHVMPAASVGDSVYVAAVIEDRDGEPSDSFTGELQVSTTDPGAVFPEGQTFTTAGSATNAGHTFRLMFSDPGEHTVTVRADNAVIGTTTVTVAASTLTASAPETAYAGIPFPLTVTPRTAGNSIATQYAADVTFTSSDSAADFGASVAGTPPTFQFECACEAGEVFHPNLSTLGTQTITVTDQFGNEDTVEIQVVAAPSTITSPIERVDRVKWRHGDTIDWYITAHSSADPFTILAVTNTCNISGWAQADDAVEIRIDPAIDRFVEFSSEVRTSICPDTWLSAPEHFLIVVDDSGHTWGEAHDGAYQRFSSIPDNTNFEMLDPGDPIAAMSTVSRPGGLIARGTEDRHIWLSHDLTLAFTNHEPATVLELYTRRAGITGYHTASEHQNRGLRSGSNQITISNYTHGCWVGPTVQGMDGGWLKYTNGSGRHGAFAQGGNIPGLSGPDSAPDPEGCLEEDPPPSKDALALAEGILSAINPANWPGNVIDHIGDVAGAIADSVVRRINEGDPVDPFSGAFTQGFTDFKLGGLSPALSLGRVYRSDRADAFAAGDSSATGAFGPGWGSTVTQRLEIDATSGAITYIGADLGKIAFNPDGSGGYVAQALSDLELETISGGFRISTKDDVTSTFDAAGVLTSFGDKSGRTMTFDYDANGDLESMTDGGGRTADFTIDTNGLITRVDLPDGRYVAFTYADGRLRTARDLAGVILTFDTDSRGRLTFIRNANDDILLHNTYDGDGRVIEQSDAVGNDAYFTYNTAGRITQFVDPLGAVATNCYSDRGQVVARMDAEGGLLRWAYDASGHLRSATDELGAVTQYRFTGGRLTELRDPLGRTMTMTYDSNGELTGATDAAGNELSISLNVAGLPESFTLSTPPGDPNPDSIVLGSINYNSDGLPTVVAGPDGATVTTAYDSRGYPVSVADQEDRVTTMTVDARGYVTAEVSPLGNLTGAIPADYTSTTTYDDMGRVLTTTNSEDETWTYTYDDFGRLLTTSSPLGFVTTNSYDLDGRLLTTTSQLDATSSTTVTYEYDAAGRMSAVEDAEQRRVEFEYDRVGRLVLTRDQADGETVTEYDATGRPTAVTDATGRSSSHEYDLAGRLIKTIDPAGEETVYSYDELDQLLSVVDPLTHATSFDYDWLGRQTEITDAEQRTQSTTYDEAGRPLTVTDNANRTTEFEYNDAGQLTRVTDAASGEATFAYDGEGRLESRTNPRNKSETYAYDRVGRLVSVTDADNSVWQTFYDGDGRVSYTLDAEGLRTDFVIDRSGRVLAIEPADSAEDVEFSYDDSGRVLSMTDENGATTYDYDPAGRLQAVTRGGRTVGYEYDDAGRLTTVVYPGGSDEVTYGYDTAGRLETITDWASRTHTFAYDAASRITSIAGPGGLVREMTYDDIDRITALDYTRSSTSLLALDYTYDAAGNVATHTDDAGTTSYTYDALDRLTGADHPGAGAFTYGWDAAGNLLTIDGPTDLVTRTYSDGDRLLTDDRLVEGTLTNAPTTDDAGWTDAGDGVASDDEYATAAPATGSAVSVVYNDFDFSALPSAADVTGVSVELEWAVDQGGLQSTLSSETHDDSTLLGSASDSTPPTSDTAESYALSALTRSQLLAADLEVTVSAALGTGTGFTARLDAVSVTVEYEVDGRTFTYNDNGALLDDSAGTSYTYDTQGRLTGMAGPDVNASYTLDGLGNRVAATVNGDTTTFDLDYQGLTSVLSDGDRRFLPGGTNIGYEQGGDWSGSLTNLQGSVLGQVDAAGTVSSLAHYDPWGLPLDGSALPTGPSFTGEWSDETGLVNLRFRSYDPTLQRFLGRDSLAGAHTAPQTWNRFGYANANPLGNTDPTGHFAQALMRDPIGKIGDVGAVVVDAAAAVVEFTPIGDLMAAYGATTGQDFVTGAQLSDEERALYAAAILPYVPRAVTKAIGKAAATGRSIEGLRAAAIKADDLSRSPARVDEGVAGRVLAGRRFHGRGDLPAKLSSGGTPAGPQPSRTTLHRAVEPDELADIRASGRYRVPEGIGEGKYFYPTKDQAALFARLNPGRSYTLTSAEFTEEVLRNSWHGTIGGEGSAYFIPSSYFPFGPVDIGGRLP